MLRTISNEVFIGTLGQVIPKWIVWSVPNSNSSEILSLSWLPASLSKIPSNVKALSSGQEFLHNKSMWKCVVAQVTPKRTVDLGRNWSRHGLVICKFHEDPIKNENAILWSVWTDAHRSFCWLCRALAQILCLRSKSVSSLSVTMWQGYDVTEALEHTTVSFWC